jgi:hypothetical protein
LVGARAQLFAPLAGNVDFALIRRPFSRGIVSNRLTRLRTLWILFLSSVSELAI